jgi:hypothetical protein
MLLVDEVPRAPPDGDDDDPADAGGAERRARERSIRANRRRKFVDALTGDTLEIGARRRSADDAGADPASQRRCASSAGRGSRTTSVPSPGRSSSCAARPHIPVRRSQHANRATCRSRARSARRRSRASAPSTRRWPRSRSRAGARGSTRRCGTRSRSTCRGRGRASRCGCTPRRSACVAWPGRARGLTRALQSLERILYVWALRHPASGYVQGINDLATPFYEVFLSAYIGAPPARVPAPG